MSMIFKAKQVFVSFHFILKTTVSLNSYKINPPMILNKNETLITTIKDKIIFLNEGVLSSQPANSSSILEMPAVTEDAQ